VEPRARFDEHANIRWADEYREAGVKVILGIPVLKVHCKLCLITRHEGGEPRYYSAVGTGNFNEDTAGLYTDHMLLTSHPGIGKDIQKIFEFFASPYTPPKLKHLVAAPFDLREKVHYWIEREIKNAKAGKKARISIKINNFSDPEMVKHFYKASSAGVKVRFIARGMFSLIPGIKGVSENIRGIGIVDRLLEHSRFFIFENAGKPVYFFSSADFLPRNFDSRFEIVSPVYDPKLQHELSASFDVQWHDGVKARELDADLTNKIQEVGSAVRSQDALIEYFKEKAKKAD
jgi:polyphosphate kinase